MMKNNNLKKCLTATMLLGVFFLCTGWTPIYYEGTYKGKVVDEATGEPIEGAVALATWQKCFPSVAGKMCNYYDAQDAVTNEKGEFEISGQGIRLFTFLEKMGVGVFKAGYRFKGPDWGKEKIKGRWLFSLKKLSMEQRKNLSPAARPPSPPHEAQHEKVDNFWTELNKDREERGITGKLGPENRK